LAGIELPTPELLSTNHDLAGFACGNPALNDWLHNRALANQTSGASRSYVAVHRGRIVGYYALAAGGIALVDAPGRLRRNMPDPIPMAILGRLAVAEQFQGRGVGAFLLEDAIRRSQHAAEILAIRGVVVHAIDEAARGFYLRFGFVVSPTKPMTLLFSFRGVDR
jgi:GNAT superfamily N-acetyltransferase